MARTELTILEALRDPMIGLMLRADRVSLRDFAKLLEEAASATNQIANSTVTSSRQAGINRRFPTRIDRYAR